MHIDYMMRRVSSVAWLILLAVNGSCFTRYAVDYTLSTRSIGPENQQNELQFPPRNAFDVLSEAKTVALHRPTIASKPPKERTLPVSDAARS